ncbi:MAG: Ig-like domain-containing protein [Clostridia bacterium]|nr:Ig-like domain-containing protein [Clostridia bacterium]
MNRRKLLTILICVSFSLLLSLWTGAGICAYENSASALYMNESYRGDEGQHNISLAPAHSGQYLFYAFSKEPVYAEILVDGECVSSAYLPAALSVRENASVTVSLDASSSFTFEVMRSSYGRNVLSPIELAPGSINRTLTRAYDVHWYAYQAQEDEEILVKASAGINDGTAPAVSLLRADGRSFGRTYAFSGGEGGFAKVKKGEICYVRVCANGSNTGSYSLSLSLSNDISASAGFSFEKNEITLESGQFLRLIPENEAALAEKTMLWESGDTNVAQVNSEGIVTAVNEGECLITRSGFFGLSESILIRVTPAKLTGVSFSQDSLSAIVGDTLYLEWRAEPSYAAQPEAFFSSSDESIALVDNTGRVQALKTGEAVITVRLSETDFTASMHITVKKPDPIYRALAVGISSYPDGRSRMGCVNTTQGISDALSHTAYSSSGYLTDMRLDLSKSELSFAIREAFFGASESDISLFYINCHGGTQSGLAWLEMYGGEKLYAHELERMLRDIPGIVIVIIDCCNSGAFIGSSSEPDKFSDGIVGAFSSSQGSGGRFASSKYKLLVSSSFDQNSYRIAPSPPATEGTMSTVFALSLAEGLGWNITKDKSGSMKADIDRDRQITLHEAWLYTMKTCMAYLKNSTARQTVQVWPRGDTFVIMK